MAEATNLTPNATSEYSAWVLYYGQTRLHGKVAFRKEPVCQSGGYLLGTRKGWEFLCDFSEYAYFRDGRGLTIKMLDKALKPNTRSKNEPAAFGDVSGTAGSERLNVERAEVYLCKW